MLKICSKKETDTLFVSFAGHGRGMGKLPQFEFQNFLKKNFDCDFVFYLDKTNTWYHQGIEDLTKNISETTSYLEKLISHYKHVYFIGSSAGGYAAILFGTLVNKTVKVIAFEPQTILPKKMNLGYDNLKDIIKTSATMFHLFADSTTTDIYHSISHCNNLKGFVNVTIYPRKTLNLKEMRDSGELLEIFLKIKNYNYLKFIGRYLENTHTGEITHYSNRTSGEYYCCLYCRAHTHPEYSCKCVFGIEFIENLNITHFSLIHEYFYFKFCRSKYRENFYIETQIGNFIKPDRFCPSDLRGYYIINGNLILNFNNDYNLIHFDFEKYKCCYARFKKLFFIFLNLSDFFDGTIDLGEFNDKIKINHTVFEKENLFYVKQN